MRFLGAILILGLGIAVGWFLRDAQEDPAPQRSSRSAELREPSVPDRVVEAPIEHPVPTHEEAVRDLPEDVTEAAPKAAEDKPEANPEQAQFASFIKSAMPLIKMQSKREAKQKAAELAKLLGLDEYREKQLAEALEKDAVAKLEVGLLPMLEGEEPDEEAMLALNETDGMTQSLQDDLALILNNSEMEKVRQHYREEQERQRREMIEMEIQSLAVPDLTKDQEERLREVIRAEHSGENVEVTDTKSLKKKLDGGFTKEGMLQALDEGWRKRREKFAAFMTPEQLAHLDKQHEEQRAETEAAAGMMGGMFGAFMTKKPSGKTQIKVSAKAKTGKKEEKK